MEIGDSVIVPVKNRAETKRHKTMMEVEGTIVYMGPKFVVVDLGNYRDSFGYDEIRVV